MQDGFRHGLSSAGVLSPLMNAPDLKHWPEGLVLHFGVPFPKEIDARIDQQFQHERSGQVRPTIGATTRFIMSDPAPIDHMIGINPINAALTVIILGRTRLTAP